MGTLRAEDALGRWGGEEFIAVLTESPAASISLIAERMRRVIADKAFLLDNGTSIPVTVSIGFTCGVGDAEVLVRQADDALYQAKDAGRNQVIGAAVG